MNDFTTKAFKWRREVRIKRTFSRQIVKSFNSEQRYWRLKNRDKSSNCAITDKKYQDNRHSSLLTWIIICLILTTTKKYLITIFLSCTYKCCIWLLTLVALYAKSFFALSLSLSLFPRNYQPNAINCNNVQDTKTTIKHNNHNFRLIFIFFVVFQFSPTTKPR